MFVCAKKFLLNSMIHRVGKEGQCGLNDLTVHEFGINTNNLHGGYIVSVAYRMLF